MIDEKIKPGEIIGRAIDRDGNLLDLPEEAHFYTCKKCGQSVDKRDLGQVFHHEDSGHEPLPRN